LHRPNVGCRPRWLKILRRAAVAHG
jgi:hypothetical protein